MAVSLRDSRLTAIVTAMDAGAGPAEMRFYNAPRPATGGAVTTLVGTNVLSDPSGTVSSGVLTFNSISDDVSADADEDIAWARIVDSDNNFIMDLDCGISGSGAEIIFNTVTARIGGVIQVLSGSLTEGNP
jgi:hypothetical protein